MVLQVLGARDIYRALTVRWLQKPVWTVVRRRVADYEVQRSVTGEVVGRSGSTYCCTQQKPCPCAYYITPGIDTVVVSSMSDFRCGRVLFSVKPPPMYVLVLVCVWSSHDPFWGPRDNVPNNG